MGKSWITTEKAVEISGYHPIYLRELLRNSKIEGRKFGRVWQVDEDSLKQYLQKAQESADGRHGPKD